MSVLNHSSAVLPATTRSIEGCMGPRAGLDVFENKKSYSIVNIRYSFLSVLQSSGWLLTIIINGRNGARAWEKTACCITSVIITVCAVCLVSWKVGEMVVVCEPTSNSYYPRLHLLRLIPDYTDTCTICTAGTGSSSVSDHNRPSIVLCALHDGAVF